jgi:redox-sensitive bicupin YhaK (pirin superfamily)
MDAIVHKANTRGHFNHGWLNTYHTFSFANYYDLNRMNFGALRVLNDDTVQAGRGFGRHPHDNMEIISLPLEGEILHRDSMGHEESIKTGEVQVMSAGTGLFHEEFNASVELPLNFLQLWILPKSHDIRPRYDQKFFNKDEAINHWQLLASGENGQGLFINQNAKISRVYLSKGATIDYELGKGSYGSYLFVIDGDLSIGSLELSKRDGVGIYNTHSFETHALSDAYLLNIEVPN